MMFNDFVHNYSLKNEATPSVKVYQVFPSIGLDNVDFSLRNGPFSSDIGIINLHASEGTHWVVYINETCFDSYGCPPTQKLTKFIIK